MKPEYRRQDRARWAGRAGAAGALLGLLLGGAAEARRAPREQPQGGTERIEERTRKDSARLERRQARLRHHEAYELGRREALAEAAGRCGETAEGRGRVTVAGPALVGDWRVSPLYATARARRIFVNGYNSCLRGHDLDPRYRGDLPVDAPESPPAEEALPALGDDEKGYLEVHSGALWEDGARRCEQDLKERTARR